MRVIATLALALSCAACQPYGEQAVGPPPCSNYTVPVIVGGEQRQAAVEACPQADGGWRITQKTPGLPDQIYIVPAPAPYPSVDMYPDFFPYWVGTPWVFGLAPSIVVVQRFHHFHHHLGHRFSRHGLAGDGGHHRDPH
jgi:hypothetical protein